MDYNDINRYKEHAQQLRKQVDSYKPHYTFETEHFDHPDTMDNTPATLLYIFVMICGSIFNDRILIWVFATIIYFNHLGRHLFDKTKKK